MSATDAFNTAPPPVRIYHEYNGHTTEMGELRRDPARNALTVHPSIGADLGLSAIYAAQCAKDEPDKTVRLCFHEKIYPVPRGTEGLVLAAEIAGHLVEPQRGSVTLKMRPSPEIIRGAIEGDDIGALRTALQCGAWQDATFDDGYTGISLAAKKGKQGRSFVKLLIQNGADVNKDAEDGVTPLMAAAAGGDVDVVRMLLDAGAHLEPRDREGKNALDHASNSEIKIFLSGPYPAEAAARLKQQAEERAAAMAESATVLQRNVVPMARLTFKKN